MFVAPTLDIGLSALQGTSKIDVGCWNEEYVANGGEVVHTRSHATSQI